MMRTVEIEEADEEELRIVQEERLKMQEESRLLEAENEWRRSETPQALCVQYWASCAKLESKFSRQQLSSHEETLADAASLVAQERRLEEQEERARENRFVVCERSSRLTRLEEEAQQRHYWRQAMGTIEVHSTHIDQDDDEDIDESRFQKIDKAPDRC